MIKVVHHVRLDLSAGDEFFYSKATEGTVYKVLFVYGLRGRRDLLVTGPEAGSSTLQAFTHEVSFFDLPHNIQEAWKEACR